MIDHRNFAVWNFISKNKTPFCCQEDLSHFDREAVLIYSPGSELHIRGFWTQYSTFILTLYFWKKRTWVCCAVQTRCWLPLCFEPIKNTAAFKFYWNTFFSLNPVTFSLFGETPHCSSGVCLLCCNELINPILSNYRFVPGGPRLFGAGHGYYSLYYCQWFIFHKFPSFKKVLTPW